MLIVYPHICHLQNTNVFEYNQNLIYNEKQSSWDVLERKSLENCDRRSAEHQ